MNTHQIGRNVLDLCTLSLDKETWTAISTCSKADLSSDLTWLSPIILQSARKERANEVHWWTFVGIHRQRYGNRVSCRLHCKYKTIETLGKPLLFGVVLTNEALRNIEMFTLKKNFQLFKAEWTGWQIIITNFAKSSKALRASRLWKRIKQSNKYGRFTSQGGG